MYDYYAPNSNDAEWEGITTAKNGQISEPQNLEQQLGFQEVLSNPLSGYGIGGGGLNTDSRFEVGNGWQKMQYTHRAADGGKTVFHYQYNAGTGVVADIKIVN